MDGKSLDITKLNRTQLYEIFPEVFSENQIDLQRLKQWFGDDILVDKEHYELNWAGKSESRKEIQQQTTSTLIPDRKNSIDFESANNIFIEGENLEVLRVLQKSYFGQIKMIYIDPPYNTGNDSFVYQDNYTEKRQDYHKRTGISNSQGFLNQHDLWKKNTKENGQFHSAWLSMIYPRLYLSRNLLTPDGLIFISIDDNEVANLTLLCNEIYGEENFMGKFIWVNRTTPNDPGNGFATDHEYILVYSKTNKPFKFKGLVKDLSNYKNPDNDPNGDWIADNPTAASGSASYKFPIVNPFTNETYTPPKGRYWAFSPKRVDEWFKSGKLVFPKVVGKNFLLKKYKTELKSDCKPISSVIQGILTANGTKELKTLFGDASPFKYPKPSTLLKMLIDQVTDADDTILDFFAGSGTTAQAVIELNTEKKTNRKFICVQMPEKYQSEDRDLNKQYKFVSDVTRLRIKKVIAQQNLIQSNADADHLNLKCFKLAPSQFKIWQGSVAGLQQITQQLENFTESAEYLQNENLLFELLLKGGSPLTADILHFKTPSDYYLVNKSVAYIFNEISQPLVAHIIEKHKPNIVFCLDKVFEGNDALKANINQQLKQHTITLKTI